MSTHRIAHLKAQGIIMRMAHAGEALVFCAAELGRELSAAERELWAAVKANTSLEQREQAIACGVKLAAVVARRANPAPVIAVVLGALEGAADAVEVVTSDDSQLMTPPQPAGTRRKKRRPRKPE